jgi:hypothetical protein
MFGKLSEMSYCMTLLVLFIRLPAVSILPAVNLPTVNLPTVNLPTVNFTGIYLRL